MAVFISYQRADESTAKNIADIFKAVGIEFYLDLLDPGVKSVENATRAILAGLAKCSHLLAVVSPTTQSSWWVPFEIGAATIGQQRIATYSSSVVSLPDFLTIWPVLKGNDAVTKFIEYYKADIIVLQESRNVQKAATTQIRSATDFHAGLKRSLGQS